MPTENRSSSNHATRTFTLDSLTAALEQVQALHEISADLIAESVFGQPAQQGQGEPVAFEIEVSGYTTLLARTHNKADATAAHYRALGHTVDIRPLGPLADHAEAERLRQKVSDLTVSGHQEYMRCEKMRAQLAEAQALLREAAKSPWLYDVRGSIRGYLSARAEPSAPVEINEPVCKGAWQLGTACGKCRRCKENPPT